MYNVTLELLFKSPFSTHILFNCTCAMSYLHNLLLGTTTIDQALFQALYIHQIHIILNTIYQEGTWVVQLVKRLTSAQVMISRFRSLSPASG